MHGGCGRSGQSAVNSPRPLTLRYSTRSLCRAAWPFGFPVRSPSCLGWLLHCRLWTLSQFPSPPNPYYWLKPIRSSPSNTFSQNPQNFLHRDPDVGTGAIFCGLGHSLSATCQVSLFGSFPVSVLRRFADVPEAPALRWPLTIGRAIGGELFGTFASISSDSARKHAGHAALCPSRAVLRIRSPLARSA